MTLIGSYLSLNGACVTCQWVVCCGERKACAVWTFTYQLCGVSFSVIIRELQWNLNYLPHVCFQNILNFSATVGLVCIPAHRHHFHSLDTKTMSHCPYAFNIQHFSFCCSINFTMTDFCSVSLSTIHYKYCAVLQSNIISPWDLTGIIMHAVSMNTIRW